MTFFVMTTIYCTCAWETPIAQIPKENGVFLQLQKFIQSFPLPKVNYTAITNVFTLVWQCANLLLWCCWKYLL